MLVAVKMKIGGCMGENKTTLLRFPSVNDGYGLIAKYPTAVNQKNPEKG